MVALQVLHSVKKPKSKFKKSEIPPSLVYETLNGKKIYYRDYEAVMNGEKNLEEVKPMYALQSLIHSFFQEYVLLNLKEYRCLNNVEIHFQSKNKLSVDFAIYERKTFEKKHILDVFLKIPPNIAVLIDIRIALEKTNDLKYIIEKIRMLLNQGTEKVVWILTEQKIAFVATPNENWQIIEWNKSFELIEGHSVNLAELFKTYNIE